MIDEESDSDSSSKTRSSEFRGESDGSLSHSFRCSLFMEVVVKGYIPSQWSPWNGSSARMSAHVSAGGDKGGFAIASR